MQTISLRGVLAITVGLTLGGCSALNDFGRYVFDGPSDGGPRDAGPIDGGPRDGGPDAGMPDGGPVDGGRDGGPGDGGIDGGPRGPTAVVQTSGGAVIQTSEHRLRISVGAPQPVGAARSSSHRLRMGPVPR